MARIPKTVFISYRRTNVAHAIKIYQLLEEAGYDPFLDIKDMGSGAWRVIIQREIEHRAHFMLLLTPSAVERFIEPNDVMRFEIETALTYKRNLVPLMFEGFTYSDPRIRNYLTGKLAILSEYNAFPINWRRLKKDVQELTARFMSVHPDDVVHPMMEESQKRDSSYLGGEILDDGIIVPEPNVKDEEYDADEQAETSPSTPTPIAIHPATDITPDFDSMTPEQIMAWMETLAIRQGATDGIITDATSRPQVQEIDPTTVDIKDNYIPYGMTAEQWEKKRAEEEKKSNRIEMKMEEVRRQQPSAPLYPTRTSAKKSGGTPVTTVLMSVVMLPIWAVGRVYVVIRDLINPRPSTTGAPLPPRQSSEPPPSPKPAPAPVIRPSEQPAPVPPPQSAPGRASSQFDMSEAELLLMMRQAIANLPPVSDEELASEEAEELG